MALVHLSQAHWDIQERRVMPCPTCKRRRRFVAQHQLWYGWHLVCCGCGDAWDDGWRLERPFRRGWRREAIAKARRLWSELPNQRARRTPARKESLHARS